MIEMIYNSLADIEDDRSELLLARQVDSFGKLVPTEPVLPPYISDITKNIPYAKVDESMRLSKKNIRIINKEIEIW